MEQTLIPMATQTDCGPTLLANLMAPILRRDPFALRTEIQEHFGFPNNGGFRDDFWDNPVRHEQVIRDYLLDRGLTLRVVGRDYPGPAGVLLRARSKPWVWHWALFLGKFPDDSGYQWHDGRNTGVTQENSLRPSVWSEVLRYAIVPPSEGKPLAWTWRAWRDLVRLFGV